MKSSRMSLFFVIIFFFTTIPLYPITLDQSFINKKSIEIEKKITQDRYIMYGLTTMAIMYGICQFMPVLSTAISQQASISTDSPKVSDVEIKKENKQLLVGQILKSGMQSFTSGTYNVFHNLFCTQESWLFMAQCAVGGLGANIITQISEQYIHPDTLRWYMHNHAPYASTIKLMKERIVELQDALLSEEQRKVSNKILLLLYERLVRQAHLISAYITYKIKYLDQAEKKMGKQIKQSMIKTHMQSLTAIEQQFDTSEYDFAGLEKSLDDYAQAIATQVNHFALAESETKKDRVSVKKYSKI